MKSEFDKEIDWLLRGQTKAARRGGTAPAHDATANADGRGNGHEMSPEMGAASSHLDADELSAYAENALPPATRSRYMAHLADCDQCRKIATSIALGAGVAVALAKSHTTTTEKIPASSSWLAWLPSALSPRVLRYAAPALAVLVVGVVAFVAVRQQPGNMLVTHREEKNQEMPAAGTTGTAAVQPSGDTTATTQADDPSQTAPSTTSTATTAGDVSPDGNNPAQPVRPDSNVGGVVNPDVRAPLNEPSRSEGAVANTASPILKDGVDVEAKESQLEARGPSAGMAVNQSPPAAPKPVTTEEASTADAVNASSARGDLDENARKSRGREESAALSRDRAGSSRAGGGGRNEGSYQSEYPPPPQRSQSRQRPATGQAGETRSQTAAESGRETETRSVGGRRFRRHDGAWVDTAYRAAQATVSVRRGSEQFRALVADEPELRRIADQLGGEIFVVWRGRAYRIR